MIKSNILLECFWLKNKYDERNNPSAVSAFWCWNQNRSLGIKKVQTKWCSNSVTFLSVQIEAKKLQIVILRLRKTDVVDWKNPEFMFPFVESVILYQVLIEEICKQ